MTIELHPLCTLFPRIEGAEFDALVADIKANGLRDAIVIHDGMILDGGNRYRACLEAGIAPRIKEFDGKNIVSFVLSANLHRRHLSPGQQAAIVASAQDWAKAQGRGGNGSNQHKEQSGNLAGLQTVADRAATSGAGERTQRMADKVAKESPELAKQVAHGEISLPKAVEQITGKRPGAKEKPPESKPEDFDERDMAIESLQTLVEHLQVENDELKNQLAAGGNADYQTRLDELLAENKHLKTMNSGLTEARDRVMRENVSLRKQAEYAAKKLKAIDRAAA